MMQDIAFAYFSNLWLGDRWFGFDGAGHYNARSRCFDWSTHDVDEWELVKQGNLPMAIIVAAVVISLGIVVSSAIHP